MWIREKKENLIGSVFGTKAQVVAEIVKLLEMTEYKLPSTEGEKKIFFSNGKAYIQRVDGRRNEITVIAGPNSTYPMDQERILIISIPTSEDAVAMRRIYQNTVVDLINNRTMLKALPDLEGRLAAISEKVGPLMALYLERDFVNKLHRTGEIWRTSTTNLNITTLINNMGSKLDNIINSSGWTDADREGFTVIFEYDR